MRENWRARLAAFWRREWLPCLLVAALFAVRLLAVSYLNVTYTLYSDDMSYVRSGVYLAQTGTLTMHNTYPSAQIMPGLPAVIAVFYLIFGEGTALWMALKLLWIALGSLTGWFVYHSVRLYAPAWCAAVATLFLFRTDFIWADNILLTETPYILCFTIMLYCTLQMGKTGRRRYAVGFLAAFLIALMFRGTIISFPFFAAGYLLCVKYGWKKLLKQAAALVLALVCVLTPWTIRNYLQFDAFIPLSYGAGNPMLLGTYQGRGYPLDEELDYETNVDQVLRERFAKYYNEDGTLPERYQKYLSLEADGIKAGYRKEVWWQRSPGSFLLSYLVLKPIHMVDGVFYWDRVWNVPYVVLQDLQRCQLGLCLVILVTTIFNKGCRKQLLFLAILYLGNVMIHCAAFSFDRYNFALLPIQFIFIGIGLGQLAELVRRGLARRRPDRREVA